MTRAGERKIAKKEQVNGGAGHVLMEALLNEEERGEHCRIFSQVTKPAMLHFAKMETDMELRITEQNQLYL